MSLEEYRRQRDFSKSPEPTGDEAAWRRTLPRKRCFCVQKHLASRLHYDFRLEHNGILLSWAVPKGPSLNPAEKRMAVHVEDHPLAYGDFEGVIPEGYGAGVVMLWDYGTWQPEDESATDADIDEALRRGELKFSLDGYKLKGSWVLVRTRDRDATSPRQRGRSWLLIKHRDVWSGAIDITTFAPRSVKSEGVFEDILAEDMPAIWLSNKPARAGATVRMLQDVIHRAVEKMLERQQAQDTGRAGRVRRVGGAGKPSAARTRRKPDTRKPRSTASRPSHGRKKG